MCKCRCYSCSKLCVGAGAIPAVNYVQVRVLFLQWIPWFLRMSRPGEKITLKSILIQNKMKEIDTKVNNRVEIVN